MRINMEATSLGCYKTKEEAIAARREAERKYFPTTVEHTPKLQDDEL